MLQDLPMGTRRGWPAPHPHANPASSTKAETELGFAHSQGVDQEPRLLCEPHGALSGRKEDVASVIKRLMCSRNKLVPAFRFPHGKGCCWVKCKNSWGQEHVPMPGATHSLTVPPSTHLSIYPSSRY